MQKTKILLIIGILTLTIMACGISSIPLQKTETRTTNDMNAEQTTPELTSTPTYNSAIVNETLPKKDADSSSLVENSPSPTIDPITSAKNCLTKTWEIKGLSDYLIAAVPPELAEEYNLEYVDTTGQAFLILSPDEQITLQAEYLEFLFTARFAIFEVPVSVSIDGTANGFYQIDNTTLRTYGMDTNGLTASAKALDEDLIDPAQIINSIPLISSNYNSSEYFCQGDRLELELSGTPEDLPPLVFEAVR